MFRWLEPFIQDLGYALRSFRRSPAFVLVALLSLTLGIGATSAIFSVIYGVLIAPYPYAKPGEIWAPEVRAVDGRGGHGYTLDELRPLSEVPAFSSVMATSMQPVLLTGEFSPESFNGVLLTGNAFNFLGVPPVIGRTIQPSDIRSDGEAEPVVVLSHRLWLRLFEGSPSAIGRTLHLNGRPHTIIGVMPPGFEVFGPGTDLWAPLQWTPGTPQFTATFSQSVARLAPGVTPEAATRELVDLVPGMRKDFGRPNQWGQAMRVQKLQDAITGDVRPALLILLGAVGLILMLAAVNLGTLVLGRSIERVGEMAVRTALGASRGRLIKQLVAEQAVLAVCGAVAGIAVARAALPALVSRIPPEVPHVGQIALDWTVLLSVLASSVAVSIIVSLLPAALAARPNVQPLLRQARSTDTPGRRRALGALVAVQIALAVVLGIGSMLMLRSLWNLQRVDPGFTATNVLTFRLQTTSKYRALSNGLPYLEQMRDRVAALPGVIDVGLTAHLPMSGYSWTTNARRSDRPLASGEVAPTVGWRFIHSDYLQAMRIPLKRGRAFEASDVTASAPVALINETMARQFYVDPAAAVGQSMVVRSGRTGQDETVQIVGVIGDIRHNGLNREPVPELFRPLTQTFMFPMAMVVRTAGPAEQIAAAVRQAAFEIDPVVPVAEMQPLTTMIAGTLGRPRLLSFLLTIFAAAGLGLGLIGVYGVVAYRVRQREREIGIRLALGARPSLMATRVVTEGVQHAIAGIAMGLPAAFLLSRVMSSMVFGVTTHDPLTFAALPILIVAVTSMACYLPARRAARVDPVLAIKQD